MLPILRVIPVGGVLLAITILILALNPPGDPRARWPGSLAPASGELISRELHPEWPQFLWRAALRRAEELNRLRELPDTPVTSVPPEAPPKVEKAPDIAAVPRIRTDAEPEDVTGTIVQSPGAKLPLDIGETSSTELPVIPHEEQPPAILTPERANPAHESSAAPEPSKPPQESNIGPAPTKRPLKIVHHARRTKAAPKKQASAQFNLFDALFGNTNQSAANANRSSTAVAPVQ